MTLKEIILRTSNHVLRFQISQEVFNTLHRLREKNYIMTANNHIFLTISTLAVLMCYILYTILPSMHLTTTRIMNTGPRKF